ncbi:MAG: peptidoglycan-associated lipoprotein Pal [Candidatus Aminicenantes bacterium]|nr:MAG: peptidoglycan-associated lipoprotein Pal [Candidatus Aminicenantes bacterium]
MKRILIGVLSLLLVVVFFNSCKKEAVVEPPKEEKVEKVEEVTPKVETPELTEEELLQRRTLEEINKMGYLKRIHFDFDKYFIRNDMKPVLEKNAQWLLKFPSVVVTIDGHCDERGTEEYNMALGEKRAESAKKYLANLGVPGARLKTVSYGKTKPLVKGVDEESHYMNRRDEFTIIKK